MITWHDTMSTGASVVPPRSRMASTIRLGRELVSSTRESAESYAALKAELPSMHWVRSLNNSALVSYAVSVGAGDLERSICLAVMGGRDNDSSGATVGAMAGAVAGPGGITARWTDPLHDRLSTSIPGDDGSSFAAMAARTLAIAGRVRPR